MASDPLDCVANLVHAEVTFRGFTTTRITRQTEESDIYVAVAQNSRDAKGTTGVAGGRLASIAAIHRS